MLLCPTSFSAIILILLHLCEHFKSIFAKNCLAADFVFFISQGCHFGLAFYISSILSLFQAAILNKNSISVHLFYIYCTINVARVVNFCGSNFTTWRTIFLTEYKLDSPILGCHDNFSTCILHHISCRNYHNKKTGSCCKCTIPCFVLYTIII